MTRTRQRLHAILAVVVVVAAAVLTARADSQSTVFLVRHAEKEPGGTDPSLIALGRERAESLAATLADAGITAIFSSEYKRTQETAAPLGKRLGLPVTAVPGKDLDALMSKVRALAPGGRALIVGHANTIPELAQRLTGIKVAELTESDYDRLYVATPRTDGEGELLLLHYGAAPKTAPAR